jgi:aspartate/methionine/tyrosine aminotransferase
LGWALVPQELVEDLWAHKDYTTISMGTMSDKLAVAALHEDVRPKIKARTRGILNTNWKIIEAWLQERSGTFQWVAPRAGAIVYARYDMPIESMALAERLRIEADCLIVPGAHFDMEPYVRMGFGPDVSKLEAALERCAMVVDPLRQGS